MGSSLQINNVVSLYAHVDNTNACWSYRYKCAYQRSKKTTERIARSFLYLYAYGRRGGGGPPPAGGPPAGGAPAPSAALDWTGVPRKQPMVYGKSAVAT